MRTISIALIAFYQIVVANSLQALGLKTQCRYDLTCSTYTKRAILKHGLFKGLLLGGKRILSCQSFFTVH